MGNRGDLHAHDGTLGPRRWRTKRWITCRLDPQGGRGVTFDQTGFYTSLFFHDEAVSLAAGHRPCAQCRRTDYQRFVTAWQIAHGMSASAISAADIDRDLHRARIKRG